MINMNFDYRNELKMILSERQRRNKRYSLRALAQDMGISVTALHGALSGERHLSKRNLQKVATKLEWSLGKTAEALTSLSISFDPTEQLLQEDLFCSIADWLHLAILNLARIPGVKADSLSQRLGVDAKECEVALARLIRLGMIEIKGDTLARTSPSFGTTTDVPSAAIRAFHHNNLIKAQTALDEVPVNQRHFLTIAAASNEEKLQEAKVKIEEFRKQLLLTLSTPKPDRVYFLNIQLFPVSKEATP
jgi:uncharacterized protein (TIGR02147 family)